MSTVALSLAITRYQLEMADTSFPLGSPTVSDLSYQLLTATVHHIQTGEGL
jgi:hypothetical protein